MSLKGKVYLVGAGPGDPGLLSIKAMECLHKDTSLNPRGLYNLTQTIIACSRNLPAIAESNEDDNEGFRRVMDMLDQIADFKRDNPGFEFD